MTEIDFGIKLQQLERKLEAAEQLRKEFNDFKAHAHAYADTSKDIISSCLNAARLLIDNDAQKVRAERNRLQAELDASRKLIDIDAQKVRIERNKLQAEIKKTTEDKQFCQRVVENDRLILENALHEQARGMPSLGKAFGEYLSARDELLAEWLERKPHPAQSSSDIVRGMKAERRALAERCKILEYILAYYEDLFPALAEYKEIDYSKDIQDLLVDEDQDQARAFLSAEEYDRMSQVQKYQLALDRYWTRRKSPWRLGRDYERYIGYLYEQNGYSVNYHGIEKKLEDLGIDLICRKMSEVVIIQCKYWALGRVVREKHVAQLFGTCFRHCAEQKSKHDLQLELFPHTRGSNTTIPRLITSTILSDVAKKFAELLGVEVVENCPLKSYPCIKCNISRGTGERIYHLPFDQQYDSTMIEPLTGECYVETVAEAEARGFRRAFRWRAGK